MLVVPALERIEHRDHQDRSVGGRRPGPAGHARHRPRGAGPQRRTGRHQGTRDQIGSLPDPLEGD